MSKPKFTVIVPSYKGGEYLKQCVRSILAQTYTDFEIAVLDNCSEDGSVEWLENLHDKRVRVYTSNTFLSIEDNWARALEIPKNEFMTFVCHDDLVDPNYLEVMDKLIATYPEAGLYHAHFRIIDDEGNRVRSCMPRPLTETASEFLTAILGEQRDTFGTGYVTRSADYDECGGIPSFEKLLNADCALWMLLMRGSIGANAPDECFSFRMHGTSASETSNLESYLKSRIEFINFLLDFELQDPEVAKVLGKHKNALRDTTINLYQFALVEETKKNKKIDPEIRDGFKKALLGLTQGRSLPSVNIRAREFINKNVLLRFLYISYIRMRHGRNVREE